MTGNELIEKKKAKVIPFRRRTPVEKYDFTVRREGARAPRAEHQAGDQLGEPQYRCGQRVPAVLAYGDSGATLRRQRSQGHSQARTCGAMKNETSSVVFLRARLCRR
jgi:hypothetical protein